MIIEFLHRNIRLRKNVLVESRESRWRDAHILVHRCINNFNYFIRYTRKIIDRSSGRDNARRALTEIDLAVALYASSVVVFQRLQNSYPAEGVEVFLITESWIPAVSRSRSCSMRFPRSYLHFLRARLLRIYPIGFAYRSFSSGT